MKWSISKVLVTGGAGFIGSHIVEGLLREGIQVGVLDNFSTGDRKNLSKYGSQTINVHESDISDYESTAEIVRQYDAVVHEAALVSVTRSVEDPLIVNKINVTGTLNLLKASVDCNVKRFVYASSSSVYGETETLPKKETMQTSPISPYGTTKLAAENYCRSFAKVYGLNTVCLRYFNVYGPRQKYGPYSGVIPIFFGAALENQPLTIFGDGEQIRDFTFVEDVVQANLLCLKNPVEAGEVFNIATSNSISVNQLASEIISLVGRPELKIVHAPERKGDIRASYADISKARELIGYKPEYTISEGLKQVLDWFKASKI